MVYAMFSIAILGLIVWSLAAYGLGLMGLPSCEGWVIIFTVGWEDFTLLNTFYSSDVNNMIQSAGNSTMFIQNARLFFSSSAPALTLAGEKEEGGSSETIRESSFYIFRKTYESYFGKKFEESDDWLF